MFSRDQYELLDFGRGRKLERFAGRTLDRPCPAADGSKPRDPAAWSRADARFLRTDQPATSGWHATEQDRAWALSYGPLRFALKLTDFGHVGLFPEQAENWDWLSEQLRCRIQGCRIQADTASPSKPFRILNLFAYTGGSTLAAALAGAQVTHVDAARNIVGWARENAAQSGLDQAPIRWITEDARKFTARERKRKRQYEGLILDPPAYGHGPKGQTWKIERDLEPLLADCAELTRGDPAMLLLTCHTQGYGPHELQAVVRRTMGERVCSPGRQREVYCDELCLQEAGGRKLHSGVVLRMASR